jgi:hypothetical protein
MLFDIDIVQEATHSVSENTQKYVGQVASVQRLVQEAADAVSQVGDTSGSLVGVGLLGHTRHESSHGECWLIVPLLLALVAPQHAFYSCCLASGASRRHQREDKACW